MDGITKVKNLDEAFQAVRKRRPFVYYHSPELRFLYRPKDDSSALFLVALKNNGISLEHCNRIAAEMGVFLVGKPTNSVEYNGWRCFGFDLELRQIV